MDDPFRKLLKQTSPLDELAQQGMKMNRLTEIASGGLAMKELERTIRGSDALLKSSGLFEQNRLADMLKGFHQPRPWEKLLASYQGLGLAGPTSKFDEFANSIAGLDRAFRFPEIGEAGKLFQKYTAQDAAMKKMFEDLSRPTRFEAEIAKLSLPWLDDLNPLKSVSAFASIDTLASVAARGVYGDIEVSAMVRQSLGDWRDEMTFPVSMDHFARTTLYVDQGVDPELTDFPEESFTEIIEVVGFAYNDDYSGIFGVNGPDAEGMRRNTDAYEHLIGLEIALRQFITAVLLKHAGTNWWKQRIPGDILTRWRDNMNKARIAGHAVKPLIEYADFMDYHQIITRADNWDEVFKHIFIRQESIRETFNRLHPVRNSDMHGRILTPEDLLLVVFEKSLLLNRMRSFSQTLQ